MFLVTILLYYIALCFYIEGKVTHAKFLPRKFLAIRYLSIHQSIRPFIHPSICLFIHPSIHSSICSFIHLKQIHLRTSIHQSISSSTSPPVHPSIYTSIRRPTHPLRPGFEQPGNLWSLLLGHHQPLPASVRVTDLPHHTPLP